MRARPATTRVYPRAGDKLSPNQCVLAWRLATGRRITIAEIYSALYGDPEHGGPDGLDSVVYAMICKIRTKSGFDIVSINNLGWIIPSEQLEDFRDYLAQDIAREKRAVRSIQ